MPTNMGRYWRGERRDEWRSERDDERFFDRDDRSERWSGRERSDDRDWSRERSERGDWTRGDRGWDRNLGSRAFERDDRRSYGGYRAQPYGGSLSTGWGTGYSDEQRERGMHRGKGPRGFTRSDERIKELVCEALTYDDHVDATNIEVTVADGEVTLSGTVTDRRSKRRAEDVIEDLPGVKDVHNRVRVQRGDPRENTIDQLNSFLRGELSAVETYRMALEKLDRGSSARSDLEGCLRSHEERVTILRDQIQRLGGTPAKSSGAWGVFTKIIEGGARMLGDKAAIAALEEGEDHGLKDYKDHVDQLDSETRNLVTSRLLAQQETTHSRMSSLKRRLQS